MGAAGGDFDGVFLAGVLGAVGPLEKPSEEVPVLVVEGGEVVAGFVERGLLLGAPVRCPGPARAEGVDAALEGAEGVGVGRGRDFGDRIDGVF
jgi:hypothetical protein